MNTLALIQAELTDYLELITRLSEAAIIQEARTSSVTSVFVVLGVRADRAGFEADVIVRDLSGRVRAVAVIAVLLDAPGDQVAAVKRDVLRDELNLTGAFAELSGHDTSVGCESRPFSWMEGLYRHAVRRRFTRHRLIATLHAVAMRTSWKEDGDRER